MAPNSQNTETNTDLPEPIAIPAESIRVEDKIYSARTLAKMHPGGQLFVKSFAGRDASQAFLSYHRRKFPHSRVQSALEVTDPTITVDPKLNDDFLELCDRVDKVVPRLQSFAPWHYYIKAVFIMTMVVGLEMYMHYTANYRWYISALCGFFHALVGLAIQHDANHGALSRNPTVNRLWGLTVNWVGGSAISWIHQHVVQHHVHTNDVNLDPDIEGRPIIRLNPRKPLLKHHWMQHVYFFFIIMGYGFSVIYSSMTTMIEGINYTPVSPLLRKHRLFEVSTSLLYYFRWVVLPLYQVPSVWTLLNVAPLLMVVGWWLSFFFTLSHNFDGVTMLDDTRPTRSWLYNQVVTSSNVCGPWLCFLNGGLNYQIEHHLFPRMHHGHYPKIAPVVEQFCLEKGLPYRHFDSIWENAMACSRHLFDMGHSEVPRAAKSIKLTANAAMS